MPRGGATITEKKHLIRLELPADECVELRIAAARLGLSMAAFARKFVLDAARVTNKESRGR